MIETECFTFEDGKIADVSLVECAESALPVQQTGQSDLFVTRLLFFHSDDNVVKLEENSFTVHEQNGPVEKKEKWTYRDVTLNLTENNCDIQITFITFRK